MTQDSRKGRDCQSDNGEKVPPELDRIVDKVLAYKPKPIEKKKATKNGKKNKKK